MAIRNEDLVTAERAMRINSFVEDHHNIVLLNMERNAPLIDHVILDVLCLQTELQEVQTEFTVVAVGMENSSHVREAILVMQ